MADGGTFVENCTIGGFELLDDRSGTVARCFDDPDTLIDDDFRVAVIVWGYEGGQEGEIDAEWVLGHCSTSSDFLAEVFRGRLCESGELLQWVSLVFKSGLKSMAYNTESSGVADSTCEFSVAHPGIHVSCRVHREQKLQPTIAYHLGQQVLHKGQWVLCTAGSRLAIPLIPSCLVMAVLKGMMS